MFGNHGLCGLLEEGAHGKSPKCLGGNLGDFGEFCKGLELNHAAAIKTGGSSAAAPFVRRTDKAHAVQHQLLRTLGVVDIADADGLDFSGSSVGFGRRTVFAC